MTEIAAIDVRKGAHARGGAALLLFCAVALIAWGLAGPNGVATIAAVKAFAALNPALAAAVFSAAFVLLAALAVPAVWFMGLAAGALFGPWLGVPLALASAVAGATVAMLIARHLLRDEVERRWPGLARRFETAAGPDGAAALFAARLMPVLPFPLVNLAAGLSAMPTRTFAAVTALGMLPLLSISVCAGAELGTISISSPADVLSPRCVAALAILGAAPLAARGLARRGRSLRAALLKPH